MAVLPDSRNFPQEIDPITASPDSIKPPSRSSIVLFDVEHEIDLEACRLQAAVRSTELLRAGKSGGPLQIVAEAADVDRRTLTTFLDGGRVSAESLISIIERGLGLKFADIVKPSVGKEA